MPNKKLLSTQEKAPSIILKLRAQETLRARFEIPNRWWEEK